ncbi:MAG TPA: efflux transporter periplasmic adaptor subunit, partial [Steroidobacteraceae bacterium]
RAIGDKWLVTAGLKAGERVIVEGIQFAKPGAAVKPEEVSATAEPAPAAPQPGTGAPGAPAGQSNTSPQSGS